MAGRISEEEDKELHEAIKQFLHEKGIKSGNFVADTGIKGIKQPTFNQGVRSGRVEYFSRVNAKRIWDVIRQPQSQISMPDVRQTERNPIKDHCDCNCDLWKNVAALTQPGNLSIAQQIQAAALVGSYKLWMRFREKEPPIDNYYGIEIYNCRGCLNEKRSPSILFRVESYPYARPHHPGYGIVFNLDGTVHINMLETNRQMFFIFRSAHPQIRPRPGIFTLLEREGVVSEKCLLVKNDSDADRALREQPHIIKTLIDNDKDIIDGFLRASRDWIRE